MELGYTAKILKMILETISEFVKIRFCLHRSNPGMSSVSSNMYIEVLSFELLDGPALMPTPSCNESEYISLCLSANKRPTISDLASAGSIEILADYRGAMLYCAGDVSVYRHEPKTPGGIGCVSPAPHGLEENVYMTTSVGDFYARIKFVNPPAWYGPEPPTTETSGAEGVERLKVIPLHPMMSQSDLESIAKDVGTELLNEFLETNKWPSEAWEGMVLRVNRLERNM